MVFVCTKPFIFGMLMQATSIALSLESSADSTFALDFCALSSPYKIQGHRLGLLQYNSSTDTTSYESCTCRVCDTSIDRKRHEDSFSFYAGAVIFSTSDQYFNYTYPHGTGWINGQWYNYTKEGSFSASLYQEGKCASFFLYLHSSLAELVLELDFEVNRSEVTITCSQQGPNKVSDGTKKSVAVEGALNDPGVDPQVIDVNAAAISIGIVAAVMFMTIAGICIFCKLNSRSRGTSHNLASDEDISPKTSTGAVTNPTVSPKLHRDLDILTIQLKSSTLLGYDNATPLFIDEETGHENPGYEPIGDSGYETIDNQRVTVKENSTSPHMEEESQGEDNHRVDLGPDNNFYHRLSESQSKLASHCSTDITNPDETESTMAGYPALEDNYYEDVVMRPSSPNTDVTERLEAVADEYGSVNRTKAKEVESTEL